MSFLSRRFIRPCIIPSLIFTCELNYSQHIQEKTEVFPLILTGTFELAIIIVQFLLNVIELVDYNMRPSSTCKQKGKQYKEIIKYGSGHVFKAVRDEYEGKLTSQKYLIVDCALDRKEITAMFMHFEFEKCFLIFNLCFSIIILSINVCFF